MPPNTVNAILLAGGKGTRMGLSTPKQFLMLGGKVLARHSFDLLVSSPEIGEITIVCEEEFQTHFSLPKTEKKISFALPGTRRQDSVYNGLQAMQTRPQFVCVHDSARPFITHKMLTDSIEAAQKKGAATTGMPLKYTIKEVDCEKLVINTPDRSKLWEIQTPQVVDHSLLTEGFAHAHKHNLTVTDDVSLVEILGRTAQIVTGSYQNLKITTQEDLSIAENYLLAHATL